MPEDNKKQTKLIGFLMFLTGISTLPQLLVLPMKNEFRRAFAQARVVDAACDDLPSLVRTLPGYSSCEGFDDDSHWVLFSKELADDFFRCSKEIDWHHRLVVQASMKYPDVKFLQEFLPESYAELMKEDCGRGPTAYFGLYQMDAEVLKRKVEQGSKSVWASCSTIFFMERAVVESRRCTSIQP